MVNNTMHAGKAHKTYFNLMFFCAFVLFSTSIFSQGITLDELSVNVESHTPALEVPQIAVAELPKYLSPYAKQPLKDQYAHLFFDPLVRWSSDYQIEKRLVRKWNVKKKGKIRFYLKKNIKFHSGYSLTSHDVAWTFKYLQGYPKAKIPFSSISKIKVVNKYTFDVYTKSTEKELLDVLTHLFILDARFYRKAKLSANQKYGILYPQGSNRSGKKLLLPISGTGPFKINSFNSNLHLKVERNTGYWGTQSFFPLLNFVLIKSDQSRVYSLIANDVAICTNVSNELINTINKSKQLKLVESPYVYSVFLTMNTKKTPAFREKTARVGIELALNRQGIVDHVLKGYGSVYPPFLPSNKVNVLEPDLTQSKALLKTSLVPKYLSLLIMETNLNTTQDTINALYNMLHRAGIALITKKVSTREEWEKNKDKYDLLLSVRESHFVEKSNQYKALFKNSYLAEVLNKDINKRLNKKKNELLTIDDYRDQINFVLNEKRIIPLFSQPELYAMNKKFNLNQIFSKNGIPYWSELMFNDIKNK